MTPWCFATALAPEMSSAAAPAEHPTLFEKLLGLLESKLPLRINFEDLTGITMDVPDLRLLQPFRIHCCDFCMLAKSNPQAHQDCIRNKMAANRVALWRRRSFQGLCHLGVSDLVRPLIYHEHVLGVFFYGSFVAEGTEAQAERRIRRYCQRRGFAPEPLLDEFTRLPRIGVADVKTAWSHLDLAAELVERIVGGFGLLDKRYRTRSGAQYMVWNSAMPSVVACALRYVNLNYSSPLRVTDIAEAQRCHPDYLSRIFKQTVGLGVGEYIARLRVDHARRLLGTERFGLGEIASMVGFYDQSHFGKVFREYVGMTPNDYRRMVRAEPGRTAPLDISYFDYSNLHQFNPAMRDMVKVEGAPDV